MKTEMKSALMSLPSIGQSFACCVNTFDPNDFRLLPIKNRNSKFKDLENRPFSKQFKGFQRKILHKLSESNLVHPLL